MLDAQISAGQNEVGWSQAGSPAWAGAQPYGGPPGMHHEVGPGYEGNKVGEPQMQQQEVMHELRA
jgi:hypothetical protein